MLAIKQTLYRTSGDSPIIDALVDAAEAGKQVLVIVEIKARFDEQANIRWARKLEHAGCHVVYGLVGLKTHCKLAMVVRDEPDGIRRYTHIGTGNYNPKTARLYEDFGLLTTDEAIGEDVAHLFNNLSGFSRNAVVRRAAGRPGLRAQRPDRARSATEIEHHRAGRPARIRIKANSIVDEALIDALYRASRAGVPVELLVRGICAVRPGVPGLSETIRVRSVLGPLPRAQPDLLVRRTAASRSAWIGSADLMHRNLDRRVEVLVRLPVAGRGARGRAACSTWPSTRHTAGWELDSDGTWTRPVPRRPDGCWRPPGDADRPTARRPRQRCRRPEPRLSPGAQQVANSTGPSYTAEST